MLSLVQILSPTTFVTEWVSIDYCKTSDFFWLIFSVSSPPSLTTMRFPLPTFLIDECRSR